MMLKSKEYYKKLSKALAFALLGTAAISFWGYMEAAMEIKKVSGQTQECIQTAKDWAAHVDYLNEKYFLFPKLP
jgi:hypothetical protein